MPRSNATGRLIRSSGTIASTRTIASGRTLAADVALLRDTFTDSNGVALASHTMDTGSGWTLHAGTAEIQSNELDVLTVTFHNDRNEFMASADSGQANVIASVVVAGAAPANIGIGCRLSNDTNGWFLYHDTSALALDKLEAGFYTQIGAVGSSLSLGDTVQIESNSANLIVARHNANTVNTTDSFNSSSTRCALSSISDACKFNNFLVVRN